MNIKSHIQGKEKQQKGFFLAIYLRSASNSQNLLRVKENETHSAVFNVHHRFFFFFCGGRGVPGF